MANITAKDVAELRKQTGVGMMDCKKALVEADGDFERQLLSSEKRDLQHRLRNQAELPQKVL